MNFQIDVSSTYPQAAAEPKQATPPGAEEVAGLLRQMLDIQKEQLAYLRAAHASHDNVTRWRNYLNRWGDEFPGLSGGCRNAVPHLERAYGQLMTELTERLSEEEPLDSDFALQEMLDRFGMRLAQLGTILNLVAPMAEAGARNEASS